MEVFRALADFAPPDHDRPHNVLVFRKGDYFEVLETERDSRDWWGARRLDDDAIGYVPAKYLRYDERRVGKLLPEDYGRSREMHLRELEEMQRRADYRLPETDDLEIPPPDYPEDEDAVNGSSGNHSRTGGAIEPKRLPNPCVESRERMDLHRELLMNQKMGKNVLKKSELKKEFERRTTERKKREEVEHKFSKRTSLERKLEEQANKLKLQDEHNRISPEKTIQEEQQPEFVRIHSKIKSKRSTDSKDSK